MLLPSSHGCYINENIKYIHYNSRLILMALQGKVKINLYIIYIYIYIFTLWYDKHFLGNAKCHVLLLLFFSECPTKLCTLLYIHTLRVHYDSIVRACCSQSEVMILRIRESSVRVSFLYNCAPNALRMREHSIGCIHAIHSFTFVF